MHLQKLHGELADKGLAVIGFNCWDNHEIARKLMAKNSVTIPTVLDASMEAMMAAVQKYQIVAVPITYIIDREGNVAEAFVGYEEGDRRGMETLEKLGIR